MELKELQKLLSDIKALPSNEAERIVLYSQGWRVSIADKEYIDFTNIDHNTLLYVTYYVEDDRRGFVIATDDDDFDFSQPTPSPKWDDEWIGLRVPTSLVAAPLEKWLESLPLPFDYSHYFDGSFVRVFVPVPRYVYTYVHGYVRRKKYEFLSFSLYSRRVGEFSPHLRSFCHSGKQFFIDQLEELQSIASQDGERFARVCDIVAVANQHQKYQEHVIELLHALDADDDVQ